MQIFTYTNLRGQSVTFGSGPPYVFEHAQGMGSVDLDIAEDSGVYQNGNTIYGMRREPRKITLTFHVDGRPHQKTMYQYRQELLGLLSPQRAFNEDTGAYGKLTYTNDYGTWWTWAVPDTTKYERRVAEFMASCPVVFRCPSPFWFGMSQNSLVLQMSAYGFRLPFRLPFRLGSRRFSGTAINTGQVDAPVVIEIHGTGEMPTLVNHSTGARVTVTIPVPGGAILRIQTDPEDLAVTLISPDGTERSAYGYLSMDSALSEFVLRPGINEIEYQPSQPSLQSRVRLLWYSTSEGV